MTCYGAFPAVFGTFSRSGPGPTPRRHPRSRRIAWEKPPADQNCSQEPQICLFHLPKNAGETVLELLRRLFRHRYPELNSCQLSLVTTFYDLRTSYTRGRGRSSIAIGSFCRRPAKEVRQSVHSASIVFPDMFKL